MERNLKMGRDMSKPFAEDLKFVGLSEDSEYLIVASAAGDQYRLRVTPMLRAAVRLDRSAMEAAKAEHETSLPPREIQSRIRSGMTAQEISEKAHVPIELVQRYEGPVLAERQFIATNAQKVALSAEPGSPTLGQIVLDRLATRGVNTMDMVWDAYKSAGHGWIVSVTFDLDNDIRVARWTYKASARTISAIDEDAKWLSETQISDEHIPRRHLAAVRNAVFDFESAAEPPLTTGAFAQVNVGQTETEELLDKLNNMRGTRQTSAGTDDLESGHSYADQSRVYTLRHDPHNVTDTVFDQAAHAAESTGTGVSAETPEPANYPAHPAESAFSTSSAFSSRSPRSTHSAISAVSPGDSIPDEHTQSTTPRRGFPVRTEDQERRIDEEQWAPHAPMTSALSALSVATYTHKGDQPHSGTPDSADDTGEIRAQQPGDKQGKRTKSRGRSPMPTWDEIMFGSKQEETES